MHLKGLQVQVQCCFTSTETVRTVRDREVYNATPATLFTERVCFTSVRPLDETEPAASHTEQEM